MIRENQRFLNHLNMVLDALLVFLSLPASFWLRFTLFPGIPSVPLSRYVQAAVFLALGLIIETSQTLINT